MTSFSVESNDGTSDPYKDDSGNHRLLYEFLDFIETVNTGNYEHRRELLKASCTVSKVMETARKDAGIIFPADTAEL